MLPAAHPERRQLWNVDATTTRQTTHRCTPFALPSLGLIELNPSSTITLTANAVFTPECDSTYQPSDSDSLLGPSGVTDMRDPFNSSVTPQVYATGAATVIAWMLVIMLIITPRTFFVGGTGGTSGLLGRRGMISGATGGSSVIGVGSRPWLQKVAALTVAISMTMATADTFRVAKSQYEAGYMDATKLRDDVVGGMEIKVSRIISDVFLWLAQVQTLIRLFSRHKEKVIIKWVGFALIILDMTFSILNSFIGGTTTRARHFENAIPALSYLFQCALSMLYAAWVLYYAMTKRRYAFYHSMMWNISIVALFSVVAILTPLAFFITDISNYSVAGWGDYFRWVGAAAASVIVWEWVERIEALEREEKKDGILGREVFDGDDMLEIAASDEVNWPRQRPIHSNYDGHGGGSGSGGGMGGTAYTSAVNPRTFSGGLQHIPRLSTREPGIIAPLGNAHSPPTGHRTDTDDTRPFFSGYAPVPTPPPAVASPVSRTDTTSASTVYTVRYHTISEPITHPARQPHENNSTIDTLPSDTLGAESLNEKVEERLGDDIHSRMESQHTKPGRSTRWAALANPFKKQKSSPPPEVLGGQVIESLPIGSEPQRPPVHNYSRWDIKSRLGAFAAEQSEKLRDRAVGKPEEMDLPVTIIPAQPRGRTWSPDALGPQQRRNADQPSQQNAANEAGIANVGMNSIFTDNQPSFAASNRTPRPESGQRRPHVRQQTDFARREENGDFGEGSSTSNPFTSPPTSPTLQTSPSCSGRAPTEPDWLGRPET